MQTSYKHSIVTLNKVTLTLCLLLYAYLAHAQLNGIYTIGGTSPDYASFSAAVSALSSQGVSGPVVFNVRSGTYTETITIGVISGTSATNTVTFQSETGNPLNVTLQSTSFSDVVVLDGANYLSFKDMTIAYNGASSYSAIQLEDDADYITITNCHLYGTNSTSTSFSNAVIYHNESTNIYQSDYVTIENCQFYRGSFGIYNNSDSSPHADGWTVTGNSFEEHTSGAIYIDDNNGVVVSNNIITSTVDGYVGIELYSCDVVTVTGNLITLYDGQYGIDLSNTNGTSSQYSLVANNMISIEGFVYSAMYGIYGSSASYTNYYFNSINLYPTSNYSYTSCLYLAGSIDNGTVNIQNNIFAQTGGLSAHYCLYVSSTADVNEWDYNNYYTTGSARVAYSSGFRNTLANLQSYTGKDANSLDIDPGFTANDDLHTSETALQNGTSIAGISEDIDGDIRQIPPYIGADEIAAPSVANDAAITALVSPAFPPCVGSNSFEVEVTNYGTNTLTSVTINWTINSVAQTPVSATGLSVATNSSTTISLGSATLLGSTAYTFEFVISNPNGTTDDNTSNDTYTAPVTSTSLSGTYTIGGTSPDYATFNDAVADLNNYGVCGPVVFNVREGTYNEQVEVTAVDNTSATNTITFQADPANTNPAILTSGSHGFSTNYV